MAGDERKRLKMKRRKKAGTDGIKEREHGGVTKSIRDNNNNHFRF